ncbi:hypothetical protein HPP92_028804 [Vanilla planifolia]|uniref:Uncharacterized protein n=1 Tax=Vanilla planifolia TaxID=51239 RepID=A0A835U317_VANPL|nr:hypothetical protein HPP92_028804 [Vanilla planifolia]KAG0446504.1 hypothetical protein HPP92_028793 [Vanilla planifolia]
MTPAFTPEQSQVFKVDYPTASAYFSQTLTSPQLSIARQLAKLHGMSVNKLSSSVLLKVLEEMGFNGPMK